jgi:ubiquinone/menaquinone biosynthesis C-methylase UbiE
MTQDLRATYNRIAADYAVDHQHDAWIEDFVQQFVELLPPQATMLDLGCGPAWEMQQMRRDGLEQVGFDLSDELLKIAQKNNPTAKFVQGDMRHLPFEAHSFDGVFAKASLLHIKKEEVPGVIDEVERVLKPKGIFYVGIKKQRDGQRDEEVVTEDDYGYSYERPFSYWTMPEFLDVLQQKKFSILRQAELQSKGGKTTWLNILARKS